VRDRFGSAETFGPRRLGATPDLAFQPPLNQRATAPVPLRSSSIWHPGRAPNHIGRKGPGVKRAGAAPKSALGPEVLLRPGVISRSFDTHMTHAGRSRFGVAAGLKSSCGRDVQDGNIFFPCTSPDRAPGPLRPGLHGAAGPLLLPALARIE
jgi:hypothetical protein